MILLIVVDFIGCCTADSQADEDRKQLKNNLKIDELLPVTEDHPVRDYAKSAMSHSLMVRPA